jgi:hypothetical protein
MIHTNGGPTGSDVSRPVVLELGNDNSDNNHATEHDDRSNDEHRLAADLVNDQL